MKHIFTGLILLTAMLTATAEDAPQNPATNGVTAITNEVVVDNLTTNTVTADNLVTNGVIPDKLLKLAKRLEGETRIFLVKEDDVKVGKSKYFTFRFVTFQNDKYQDKEPYNSFDQYRLKLTVQLEDRKTDTVVFAHHEEDVIKKKANLMVHYKGTQWEFRIPFGEMQKPKLSAYVIEFGFEKDGYFVPLSVDLDKVDSADEILNGEGTKTEIKRYLKEALWDDR